MQNVSVHEAKTHLSRLIRKVQAGEEILITSSGKPVALITMPPKRKKRILGDLAHLADQYPLPDDFNDPMPEEWFEDPDDPLHKL